MTKTPIAATMQMALEHHRAGRVPLAEAMYRQVLQVAPDNPDALHYLGVAAHQSGQNDAALELIRRAIGIDPRHPIYHDHCGLVLQALGKFDAAIASHRKAIELKPDYAEAHNNLGNALKHQRQLDQAADSFQNALSVSPDFSEAHNNLGTVLHERGKTSEAIASYRSSLLITPNNATAHYNLGNALRDLARLDEAAESYRKALTLEPDYAEAYCNLGIALQLQGSVNAAADCYERATKLKPDYGEAHHNLGGALNALGHFDAALAAYQRALELKDAPEFRISFVRCLRSGEFTGINAGIRCLVIRAISEPWARPADLALACIRLIALDPTIGACMARSSSAWPTRLTRHELLGSAGFSVLSGEPLLRAVLENAQVCDLAMERLLTMVRHAMLDAVTEGTDPHDRDASVLTFCCALARQCFINDFVFSCTDAELDCVTALLERLATSLRLGDAVPPSWIAALAAYVPLLSLPEAEALRARSWPEAVAALLNQQITEPLRERSYRDCMPRLTAVEDGVSLSVRQQYEENPYPRWIKLPPPGSAPDIDSYLKRLFPFASMRCIGKGDDVDILVAGCGTGQESIEMARDFPAARVLAVDLSLASLSYAKRKAFELGVTNVEHAQADIMKLSSIGRKFDVITSVGVLHHLADPVAGWTELLSLLRPGGFMLVGLYSARARRSIVAAREFIAQRGYLANAAEIRRCRQELMSEQNARRFAQIAAIRDFYVTGECRDLLFHVQEHRFVIPEIKELLGQLGLCLIGFVLAPDVVNGYAKRYPDDKSMTDLDHWNDFEAQFLDAFAGMYVFWVQKTTFLH